MGRDGELRRAIQGGTMKAVTMSMIAAPVAAMTLVKAALLSGVLLTLAPGAVLGADVPKKGTTSYTSHYVFRPLGAMDVPGVGKVTSLEMVGPVENTKGEAMFDKMQARCFAVNVDSGAQKWINGACTMTDADGDLVFSTFDTRDLDKSQPDMNCGTHIITGGTGKYAGITGKEPFSCISKPTPAGEAAGVTAVDIPHNTTWEIKG